MTRPHTLRLLVVIILFLSSGCKVNYTVAAHADSDRPAQAHHLTHTTTHYAYLWGLIDKNDPLPAGCPTGSNMSRVRVTTGPGSVILSLITLGIVVPQHVEWDCSQVIRDTGETIGQ